MSDDIRGLYCGLCLGAGLLRVGQICPRCEGAGRLRRLTIALPVVTPDQVVPADGPWWSSMVVLSTEVRAGRTVVRGLTDTCLPGVAVLRDRHGLRAVVFAQVGDSP